MQLRKVCNHPDLFSPRHVSSPMFIEPIRYRVHTSFLVNMEKWSINNMVDREKMSIFDAITVFEIYPRKSGFCITSLPELVPGEKIIEPTLQVSHFSRYEILPLYGYRFLDFLNIQGYRGLWNRPCTLLKTESQRIEEFIIIFWVSSQR